MTTLDAWREIMPTGSARQGDSPNWLSFLADRVRDHDWRYVLKAKAPETLSSL